MAGLEKQAKDNEKIQAKVDREKKKLYEIERERNTIEERLNSTKLLDELEDDEARLKKLNEEDQAVIDDVNASEFDKDAARERIAARDEDLLRLKAQISERENSLPLRERIKEIFKKYGVTMTAIFLAAGVTIAAVIGTITNALKKLGTELGNGLKAFGAKAASALPGPYRGDCELSFQSCWERHWLSCRTHMALDSGSRRLSFSKIDEKELTRDNKQ